MKRYFLYFKIILRNFAKKFKMDFLNIHQTLKDKGFTYESLGKEVGLSKVSISRIVRGQQTPSFEMLYKIAQVLGVSIKDLFKDTSRELPEIIGAVYFNGKTYTLKSIKDLENLLELAKANSHES